MQCRLSSYAEDVWDTFWFEKNLQGDIVAVYNTSGVKCISYTYDAWGKSRVTVNNASGTNARAGKNPFRYRGYYYDSDLELYYLNSRYYDAKICRFISADGYVSTGQGLLGCNMYAYCNNNPVNYLDSDGNSALALIVAISITVLTVVGIVSEVVDTIEAAKNCCDLAETAIVSQNIEYEYSEAVVSYMNTGEITYSSNLETAFNGNYELYVDCLKTDSERLLSGGIIILWGAESINDPIFLSENFASWSSSRGYIATGIGRKAVYDGYDILEDAWGWYANAAD